MSGITSKCGTAERHDETAHFGVTNLATKGTLPLPCPENSDPRESLKDYIVAGAKPRAAWRCGVELELLGFSRAGRTRLDHEQVEAVIRALARDESNYTTDGGVLAGAQLTEGGNLTVEPGGQMEYSSAARASLVQIESELSGYLDRLRSSASEANAQFLAIGFDPLRTEAEQHWYPKPRYEIMRPYLATRGTRAWDMMLRTCATQVSLDFDSASDLLRKYVLGHRLAPYVTAIFANSPFADGKPSGYLSTRAWAWLATDPDRCGIPPIVGNEQASLDDLVEYALDVPMLFRRINGAYLDDVTGQPFRQFLYARDDRDDLLGDWADHLTTIFTEARVKQLIELRSADCGHLGLVMAAQAFWKGLLYDEDSFSAAERLVPDLSVPEIRELQTAVAINGLRAKTEATTTVLPIAKDLVRLATEGLGRIAPDEVPYLDILHEQVIADELCPADILLRNWEGSWHGSLARLFEYVRVP